ncbi:hypothetical protein CDD81_5769 [Ophiocordyceps australis]|uniref:FMP27 GFWDK domain-containing protein n=1 Tax=Ophiocordyceps australis TaxID=1399860 RepID=A0A2C5XI51_9HYPO|nr:hypothetical protein CDD81_5769 [Ophiocordyceps australis]
MALLNPTFLLGLVVLGYLSSFVLFAILRIVTGISIQRIGYLSLRRLAYTPKDGLRVEIRGLGFSIHRPTFAQPTWISLALDELTITIDVAELEGLKAKDDEDEKEGPQHGVDDVTGAEAKTAPLLPATPLPKERASNGHTHGTAAPGETWKKLADFKEKLKRLHGKIDWIRMVDVVATGSTINVVGVGNVQIGSCTLAVDTRNKIVDRARFFFQRSKSRQQRHQQAEWIMTLRSVLFTADGNESLEVLDHALFNVHGFLYQSKQGLLDATIALKLGRVHVPYDDIQTCLEKLARCRHQAVHPPAEQDEPLDGYVDQLAQEFQNPGSTSDDLMKTVSDSKDFFSSILGGIKEIQFAVSFVGFSTRVTSIHPATNAIVLNAAMKEVGFDLHRLDPKSPAHRMYFSSKDIAHEALAAALSISVGLDDGTGRPERLVYIPMATTTVRTTLPSKTVQLAHSGNLEEKNANILFSNSVVTSPSVDLNPRHLPLLIALMRPKPKAPQPRHSASSHLISRLLPKANIKFSMHEPVMRIKLQPMQELQDPDDYDLIISSISSVSLDVESSPSSVQDLHYFLDGSMRLQSHRLYYQTCTNDIFNLITTESCDIKANLAAEPDVCVDVTSSMQCFSISMARPEITHGLRQIVQQLRINVEPDKRSSSKSHKHRTFLRSAPSWLKRSRFEASDFNVEVAGIDEEISDETRGVSLHLDSFTAEYRARQLGGPERWTPRRRTHSRCINPCDSEPATPASPSLKKKTKNHGDGRLLTMHARGLEAQVVESVDRVETEPFLRLPRLELTMIARSDRTGPVFEIISVIKTISFNYSLYRHYAIGVAGMTLRKAFMMTARDNPRPQQQHHGEQDEHLSPGHHGSAGDSSSTLSVSDELVSVSVKAFFVQIKAEMPHEPQMLLHIHDLNASRARWSAPCFSANLIRFCIEPPRMRNVWSRMLSIKGMRAEWCETRQKTARGDLIDDNMINITSDAVRLAVPHEVVVSQIQDNCVNVVKAVAQLHHRFKTGTNEYILDKKPEGPKKVPKMRIRAENFLLELEDGAFEWKLGIIYRAGRIEQIQRLAREEAFLYKAKKAREQARKGRSRSIAARGRTAHGSSSSAWFRSHSEDGRVGAAHMRPRYDPEGDSIGINGNAKVGEEEARARLNVFNAQSWQQRINLAYQESQDRVKEQRVVFWGNDELPQEVEVTEKILAVPPRPALLSAVMRALVVNIDKPSFAMQSLPDFIHRVGKGMPRDMKYGLLVPMHIGITMTEALISLRDYPLPLLHIPGFKGSHRPGTVSIQANFVVAEEFRGMESTRRVLVNVVPPRHTGPDSTKHGSFAIEVRRTIGPIKSFSEVDMDIHTGLPTRITWAPCYQPAIQDVMMVIESFTKPPVDPSERVGFWDKIRLTMHSRVHVAWKGDGDMHLVLKGSRDPYYVTGTGAGFIMCWRNEVRWNINCEDDPKRFMTVDSGEFIWAVPDFSYLVRSAAQRDGRFLDSGSRSGAAFQKVVMKLSGKVQWMAGLVFEQAIEGGKRNFDFVPHYDVVLKHPHFAKPDDDGLPYDAMRGFRSRHIHLSIAVRAPADRDWTSQFPEPSRSYNTVHFTPRFFTHFFQWWALFSQQTMPIRQGSLFPAREKNSKKFGRHLATVKYSLLLAPLFLSHIYKHKDAEDYAEDAVSATGLKVRFDSWMLDLHQRREEFNTLGKGRNAQGRTSAIKIHAAQLDLASADVRAVSASIKGTTTEAIKKGSLAGLVVDQDDKPDLSKFIIPDNDFSWIDMDDFVELDWILPTEPHPRTKILPLAFAPRLTYFRQTDIGGTIAGDPSRTSPFGSEPTHFCITSYDDDPKRVQGELVQERLDQLEDQMLQHSRDVGDAELKVIQMNAQDGELVANLEALRKHSGVLKDKKIFLENMLEQIQGDGGRRSSLAPGDGQETLDLPSAARFESEFTNRFVIHNMQLKWNNMLRNIVLRYIHQNSQRRGFVYYLSRPAIKFILDIVEEQSRSKTGPKAASSKTGPAWASSPDMNAGESGSDFAERIRKILGDRGASASGSFVTNGDGSCTAIEDLESGISDGFSLQRGYHVRLIAPQIQLQSDKNKKHVVLVTAKGMELKVVEVMDKERISDSVSGLVQRRFLVNMDSTQFFVTHQKWFATSLVSMYAGSKYGAPNGSSWPPWVPLEIMFSFTADPFGFKRVVQKTSAMLRYDKYNNLRLKYNDEVNDGAETASAGSKTEATPETRLDNIWVEFPQARALCNSSQYYAMYVIGLDLLMYNEPLEKTRSERLEKIMLASDFSDLSGAPQLVQRLQQRIKQLEAIKLHFQTYSAALDRKGWEDRLSLERDLAACEDELFFVMKAITTSQRKHDASGSDVTALLRWSISAREIVWHLVQDSNEPLVELQLKEVEYDRTDNSDGSHMNLMRVGKILGLNLLPDATYPEIIAPYHGHDKGSTVDDSDMIRVYWHMLEAIAGIPVMDCFEVTLFPVKIQLERDVGKRLFDYIFPGMDGDKHASTARSHSLKLEIDDDDDDDANGNNNESDANSHAPTPTAHASPPAGGSSFSTRAGMLELRLKPTLWSNPPPLPQERSPKKSEHYGRRLLRSAGTGKTMLSKKASHDSLRSSRPGLMRSSTASSTLNESKKSASSRFGLRHKGGDDEAGAKRGKAQSDDLTKMMTRASSYMTFASIRVPSVVLCLSYKGRDQRNFEDVHDFVFRLPTMEWHNKTWSNLDLALALKKAVVKALISHTGAIIGNKLSKHRPNAEQRSRLRELASSSAIISAQHLQTITAGGGSSTGTLHDGASLDNSDDDSSLYGSWPIDYSRSPPTSSVPHGRAASRGSSAASSNYSLTRSGNAPTGSSRPLSSGNGNGLGIADASSHRRLLRAIGSDAKPPPPPPPPLLPGSGSSSAAAAAAATQVSDGSGLALSHSGNSGGHHVSITADGTESTTRRHGGAGGGFRERISAFAHRRGHHEEEGEGEDRTRSKMLSWAPGRNRAG